MATHLVSQIGKYTSSPCYHALKMDVLYGDEAEGRYEYDD